jgi:trans-2,3-dihydro-3-hydroxyanthranilate isomerase
MALGRPTVTFYPQPVKTYRYIHLDVFTDRAFEGNQLAVFPEPAGLTTAVMQRIAREMAFSECTFIFPSERPDTDVRMRIFTPGEELPMAGHPTVGSAFALAADGTIASGRPQFVFGLGIGPTPVALEWKGSVLDFAWMTQPLPSFGTRVADPHAFAASLGINRGDLSEGSPVQMVSCGVPFLLVPLTTRAAVDRVSLNRAEYARCLAASGLKELPVFIFTLDRANSAADELVYSRMLAPGFGVAEDPATGGASGPLGSYLLTQGLITAAQAGHSISLQGAAMGRPSRIHISIEGQADGITRVRVGGRSVVIGEGSLSF